MVGYMHCNHWSGARRALYPRQAGMPRRRKKPDTLALTAKYRPGWMDEADRRGRDVRAIMSAREALVTDLGGDLSTQREMIMDRTVFLCLRLTCLERMVLAGEDIDWSHYGHISNVFVGHLKTLGLDRQIKNIGSLKDYIEAAS